MDSGPSSSFSDRINDHDHGPTIIITAAIMLGCTVLALAIRLYQRWPWNALFKLEDAFLVAAAGFGIVNVATVALAVQYGLGQHEDTLTEDQANRTKMAMIAHFATFFLTEGTADISLALLLRSLDVHKRYRVVQLAVSGLVTMWMVAGTIRMAASASVHVGMPVKATWIGYGVISIALQVVLFASAMWMIWPLQMAISKKVICSFWFALCLPVAAVIAVRLAYTPAKTFGTDFTWNDTISTVIMLVEVNLMIISAAYPSVRNFLNKVSTGFLVAETAQSRSGERYAKQHGTASYALNSIGKRSFGRRANNTMSFGDKSEHHTATVAGDTRSDKSFGSQAIMVRRSVEIDEASVPES